ncbi:MAG: hypothetical protein MJ137_01965, partial [Clostridia bacterium]|nr:hypothetical protein [Clostridia bacterium]
HDTTTSESGTGTPAGTTSSPEVSGADTNETTEPSVSSKEEVTSSSAPAVTESPETGSAVTTEKPADTTAPVETAPHEHSMTKIEKYNETEHKLVCDCGEFSTEPHVFTSWTVITPATATTAGERYRQCVTCGFSQTETIPPEAHVHEYDGYSYSDSMHWTVCKYCKEIAPSEPHIFGVWTTTPPTTTADGSRTRSCSVCGYTETEIIPKLEHVHSYNWAYTDTVHYPLCECGEKGLESGHNFDGGWVEVLAPTEASEGRRERTCISCGYVQTEIIPKIEIIERTPISGSFSVKCDENGYLKLILKFESVSYTEKELKLNCKMYISAYSLQMGKRSASITLGGETVNFTTPDVSISSKQELLIGDKTITVPLSADQKSIKLSGTLDLNITFSGKPLTSQTVSNYITLG